MAFSLRKAAGRERGKALAYACARVELMGRAQDGPLAEERAKYDRLRDFIRGCWHAIEPGTDYQDNWHIDCISEHLEAVHSGQIKRLLINIPPRNMKTIAVSVAFPVWEWKDTPHLRYMFVTYSCDLSKDQSDQRRTIIQSDWYQRLWGRSFKLASDNVTNVVNDYRGMLFGTSMGGMATGKGANRLIFDDPHNTKTAESEVERKTTLRHFNVTFPSRLNDKKQDAILCVMQRLHEEDVAARCIELGYVHLCLPAEAEGRTVVRFPVSGREVVREPGDCLWPDREGKAELDGIRLSMGEYAYAGQYQQRPSPSGGGLFKSFPIVHAVPGNAEYVRYWDKAGTPGGGARTAGVLQASWKNTDGFRTFCICHVVKGQWSAAERERVIKETAEVDGYKVHIWEEQEPGSGGKESAENTIKMLPGYIVQREPVTGDKVTRARPMAAQAEIGNVSILHDKGTGWNQEFIDEARMFPNGRFKDQIDAASGGFNKLALLDRPAPGHASPKIVRPQIPGMIGDGLPRGTIGVGRNGV